MKFSWKNIKNWRFKKTQFILSCPFWIFFQKKNYLFFTSVPWKQVKSYLSAKMAQNFDQAKHDNTLWPMPNVLKGSVLTWKQRLRKTSLCCENKRKYREKSSSKEVQIVYRLFLVNCYLLHVPRRPSPPASNARG